MKSVIITFTFAIGLLCFGTEAQAQRNLPGEMGIQVSAGTVDRLWIKNSENEYGFYGSLALTITNKDHTR